MVDSWTWLSSNAANTSSVLLQIRYRNTVKILNIRTPKKFAVITLKFKQDGFTENPKDAAGIANSVDLDQTAVWSGSALFAQTYQSKNLGSLR